MRSQSAQEVMVEVMLCSVQHEVYLARGLPEEGARFAAGLAHGAGEALARGTKHKRVLELVLMG